MRRRMRRRILTCRRQRMSAFTADAAMRPFTKLLRAFGGSVAEWLACSTQAQKGLGSNRSRDAVG